MTGSSLSLSVVIHGHFYQPPREDPWLELLERQTGAVPHHDWNVKVERECYRAVAAARVPGPEGRISRILNALEFISFNFGPTLMAWMERQAPRTYRAILTADEASRRRCGFGNALAQAYHHTILPLASRREKRTEVRWGMVDFRRRFGRDPLGMWLPETAVDTETLEVLAEEGIRFTIVAPHQIDPLPKRGLPGLFRAGGGRSVSLFPYDGDLSHGVAFGRLLKDAGEWADEVAPAPGAPEGKAPGAPKRDSVPRIRTMATDGETFGHHHRFGEMALARVLLLLQDRPWVRVENFASFLARNPPRERVALVEPSSWSCPHGVDRWRAECGCRMDPSLPTQQKWRAVLREAMDWLGGEIHDQYAAEAPGLLGDPWEARDAYGAALAGGGGRAGEGAAAAVQELVRTRAPRDLDPEEEIRARELLELERNALRLFTSCGWFFDDLSGLEPLQVLRYAARALELVGGRAAELEEAFLDRLDAAETNEHPSRSGRTLYLEEVKPKRPLPVAVAAGEAARSALDLDPVELPGYRVEGKGGDVFRVVHRMTERVWEVGARVERHRPGRMTIRVGGLSEVDGGGSLGLDELPEAYRVPVEEVLREDLLERWVSREELIRARRTGGSLGTLVGSALEAAVSSLGSLVIADGVPVGHEFPAPGPNPTATESSPVPPNSSDPSPEFQSALDGIRDLADLHQLLGLPIPFDAQTDFYRILERAPSELAEWLSPLRDPLGFVLT